MASAFTCIIIIIIIIIITVTVYKYATVQVFLQVIFYLHLSVHSHV